MSSRARILCVSFSDLSRDPRVRRQIAALAQEHEVTAAGLADPGMSGVSFVALPTSQVKPARQRVLALARLLGRRHEAYYWAVSYIAAARAAIAGRRFDLIIANDVETWPLAIALKGDGRVLFDAHEYAPGEHAENLRWRLLYRPFRIHLCRRYLPLADGILTVCDGLADEYARVFKVRRPVVVRNIPPSNPAGIPAKDGGANAETIRLIHHGWAAPNREIERMIAAMGLLDARFTLDLMLMGQDTPYCQHLRALAKSDTKVRFIPPVPAKDIIQATTSYDLGFYLLPPTNPNNLFALPNKFFEFIHAGLGVAIGPSPEMARLARVHDFGVISTDFSPETIARELKTLGPERLREIKCNAHRAASVLNWETESALLRAEVNRTLSSAPRGEVASTCR